MTPDREMLDRRQRAVARMEKAKKMFSHAAEATLQGNALAVALTQSALAELGAAQAELRLVEDAVPAASN